MTPTRPAIRYHGGKWRLAPWIISHFPPHRTYVEPFGGGASVLLRKGRSYAEIYNDLDGEIVNLFRVLRDRTQAEELARLLYLSAYSRAEYTAAQEPADDPVEQARRTVVKSFMGFGSDATLMASGFRAATTRTGTTPAHDWTGQPANVIQLAERLRGVTVENKDACAVMVEQDGPHALHYVDPPYVHSTRALDRAKGRTRYRYEMSDSQHRDLATVLHSLRGAVVISGYPCDLYDRELYPDWRRVTRTTTADGAAPRTEVLWLNPRAAEGTPALPFLEEPI